MRTVSKLIRPDGAGRVRTVSKLIRLEDGLPLLLDDADPISHRRRNPGNDSVFTWNVCGRDLFTTRQAERFYVPLLTDLYDFDNRNSAGFSA